MIVGRVLSTTEDPLADTLATTTTALDTVLQLSDAGDFDLDEESTLTGWLVIGDSDPFEYVAVDTDAQTVTLAAAVGAVYEDGLPVDRWDPTVGASGARAVEYLARVALPDDETAVTATLPHNLIPLAGSGALIGASVELEAESPGVWGVSDVLGREALVDQSSIGIPFARGHLGADQSIPDNTETTMTGWTVDANGVENLGSGRFGILKAGVYMATPAARFASNSTGRRAVLPIYVVRGVEVRGLSVTAPGVAGATLTVQSVDSLRLNVGDEIRFVAFQTSGAALNVLGGDGFTSFSILRVGN